MNYQQQWPTHWQCGCGADHPAKCECGCDQGCSGGPPPWTPCPPPPVPPVITGPIIGVTDGTPAKPGEVGEYLMGTATGTFPPTTGGTLTEVNTAPLVVPAGDWDVQALLILYPGPGPVYVSSASFAVNPVPDG